MVARYAAAFSGFDVNAICSFWLLPAIVSVGAVTTSFRTIAELHSNVTSLCEFYRGQGMARAEVTLRNVTLPLPDCAYVSARYDLTAADGAPVAGWTHHYTLRLIDGDWRIAFAIADEEIAAWETRRMSPTI